MSTKVKKPLEASQLTHVADMPPLEVVTEGIPPQEHIGPPPVSQPPAPPVAPEHRRNWFAWALAGVIGALLVVVGIAALRQDSSPSTSDLQAGQPPQAGQEYGAGEGAYSGQLRGPAVPYIPDWSIPVIPAMASIPAMSIPPIEPIPAMSIPPIEPMSIASMSMSIPTIQPISIPATPTTPATPPNESIQPIQPISIPSISIPSMPSISFPTFPSIPSISIPPIAPFPTISFPEM